VTMAGCVADRWAVTLAASQGMNKSGFSFY